MKAKVEIELILPKMPNFIRVEGSKEPISIGQLEESAYLLFEEQYLEALRKHWKNKRKNIKS